MRRTTFAVALGVVAAMLPILHLQSTGAAQTVTVTRLSGANRYATAAAVATATYQPAGTAGAIGTRPRPDVIVASGENFPDGLAAAGLAGHLDAPILLVGKDTLPPETATALGTLTASRVHIMGGTGAISQAVRDQIAALGFTLVTTYGGTNRYDTAAKIANSIGAANVGGVNGKKTAFVVVGNNYADALAVGGPAFAGRHPILLTDTAALSPESNGALTTLGIQQVYIVGGTTAVSQAVADTITAKGIIVSRLAGVDRADTARLLANLAVTPVGSGGFGFPATGIVLYNGYDGFADGLSAGPHAGKGRYVLVPVDDSSVPSASTTFLSANKTTVTLINVIGGTTAISGSTVSQVQSTVTTGTPTATITALHGGTTFTVTFSEAINLASIGAEDFAISSAAPAETIVGVSPVAGSGNTRFTVAVGGSGLDPGDVIRLVDGTPVDELAEVTSAAAGAKVALATASVVTDSTAPIVSFTANANPTGAGTAILMTVSEPVTGLVAGDITLDGVPQGALFGTDPGPYYLSPGGLTVGRVVAVAANAFTDLAGNPVAATSVTVGTDALNPSLMSATATITRTGTDSLGFIQGVSVLIITAKTTGYTGLSAEIVAGAGNSMPVVSYNSTTKRITITLGITAGNNTPSTVASVLNSTASVNGLVSASGSGVADLVVAASAGLSGGSTSATVTVTFSEAMQGNGAGAFAIDMDGNLATLSDRYTEAAGYTTTPSGVFTITTVNPGGLALNNALAPIPGVSKLITDAAWTDFANNQLAAGTVVILS